MKNKTYSLKLDLQRIMWRSCYQQKQEKTTPNIMCTAWIHFILEMSLIQGIERDSDLRRLFPFSKTHMTPISRIIEAAVNQNITNISLPKHFTFARF